MAVLKEMFKEEKERLLKMKKFYEDKIIELPKGSIIFKQRGAKKYPYIVYREGKKVRTKYLKLSINELDKLKFNLDKRKKYLKLLKEIKEDLKVFGNIKNE
jgi:ribosomal protein L27